VLDAVERVSRDGPTGPDVRLSAKLLGCLEDVWRIGFDHELTTGRGVGERDQASVKVIADVPR